MDKQLDSASLQNCIKKGQIQWRQHALERILERGITRLEIKEAIQNGEILERYYLDKPFPSCLIYSINKEPLHVVVALDPDAEICHIITAYRPDRKHFKMDLKTRREKK